MSTQCLHCGNKINGRIDKKFCNVYCKSAYHNAKNRDESQLIRQINAILKTNYRILRKVNPYQKTKVKKDHLLQQGFDFSYFTNIYTTRKGHIYYFIYDQGYLPLDNDFYAVVKRDK
ncbi:MAG: hypothetical protein RI558_00115 [Psychroflexus sp.]|jgi:hypothetical protein|nr:hypothetical protein [Psychroflexus sp.]MDR9447607.1 hypothetical protein [Psychroflexus sp.]